MRLLIDIPTNRVVWISYDNEELVLADNVAQIDYNDVLPEGMTVKNCWNWRLIDRTLELVEKPKPDTLHQTNKEQAKNLLRKIINDKRARITKDMLFEETINLAKLDAAREYLATGTSKPILARLSVIWNIGMQETAKRIQDEWIAAERALLATECTLIEYLDKIDKTTTANDVIALHAEIAKL
jgi:hypothetical protein